MPSTGAWRAARAAEPSATFARIATEWPSEVAPGPLQFAIDAAATSAAATAAAASARSGSRVTVPRLPSSSTMVPAATSSRPGTATTHGMPSWRAMIAVWLVGPPSEVARPTTRCGSRLAVSAGARSSAHRIDGSTGIGTPGSGRPASSAMTRSRMSLRSVTRSAISPPILVNISMNWVAASAVARTAVLPALIAFSADPSQARSWASCAVAPSTSAAAPVTASARSRRRWATDDAAFANRAASAGRSDSASTAPVSSSSIAGSRLALMTGANRTPGTTGTPCSTVVFGEVMQWITANG